MVVQAAGHYKQTKKGAIVEPIINLGISCILVVRLGLIGVAIGTLVATIFRTMQYSYYMNKHLIGRSQWITMGRILVAFIEGAAVFAIVKTLNLKMPASLFDWFINAAITAGIAITVVVLLSIVFYRKDSIAFVSKVKNVLRKRP